MKSIFSAVGFFICVCFISCSGPKEETPPQKEEPKKIVVPVEKPKATFMINDRYYVKNAQLAPPTAIDDPVQAIRVIQLEPGTHEVLVLFKTDESQADNGEVVHNETWLGLELPSFAPGTYDLSDASKIQFYKFLLADKGVRYDGKTFSGDIKIRGIEDGYLIGELNIRIEGETKSFDKPTEKFDMEWKGSFRIQEVPIEATRMK